MNTKQQLKAVTERLRITTKQYDKAHEEANRLRALQAELAAEQMRLRFDLIDEGFDLAQIDHIQGGLR